ncbi:hypothetical protein PG996_004827 [Apiospora saccharicola]|uniref:Uncharacterized protein n=1 Tax=Apiospora saccharicola TaxID=335842 RepID=A0ABR1W5F0_9PEZI
MAQIPQNEVGQPQQSAMFEALATTSFEYDEINSLLPSEQHLPPSSSMAQDSGGTGITRSKNHTNDTKDFHYSEGGIETGDDDGASVPVVKGWWGVALKWARWDRSAKGYRAVRQ